MCGSRRQLGSGSTTKQSLEDPTVGVYALTAPELSRFFGIIIRMFVEVGGGSVIDLTSTLTIRTAWLCSGSIRSI